MPRTTKGDNRNQRSASIIEAQQHAWNHRCICTRRNYFPSSGGKNKTSCIGAHSVGVSSSSSAKHYSTVLDAYSQQHCLSTFLLNFHLILCLRRFVGWRITFWRQQNLDNAEIGECGFWRMQILELADAGNCRF